MISRVLGSLAMAFENHPPIPTLIFHELHVIFTTSCPFPCKSGNVCCSQLIVFKFYFLL